MPSNIKTVKRHIIQGLQWRDRFVCLPSSEYGRNACHANVNESVFYGNPTATLIEANQRLNRRGKIVYANHIRPFLHQDLPVQVPDACLFDCAPETDSIKSSCLSPRALPVLYTQLRQRTARLLLPRGILPRGLYALDTLEPERHETCPFHRRSSNQQRVGGVPIHIQRHF